jgi:glycosyltransferase involved in cell wall biosynthesis
MSFRDDDRYGSRASPPTTGWVRTSGSRPHVVWISDSPTTPSGFGTVTRNICGRLRRLGYKVTILGWQSHEPGEFEGCEVVPVAGKRFGGDVLYSLLVRKRPTAVVALADVWWLPDFAAPHVRRQLELIDAPWILYFPVDGNKADGTLPASWIQLLREVDVPVAMSKYGRRLAQECGVDCNYIPHGVDLDIFVPPLDRAMEKQRLGMGDKFVVLSDCRNQPRKLLPRLLDIFAGFAAVRSDVVLHLHTDPDDEFAQSGDYSYNVKGDMELLKLQDKVRFTPGFAMRSNMGLAERELAGYYQAADVHLLASSGEGFGLPTLQAAATGVVPLATAYSASHELVAGHGEAVSVSGWSENEFGIRRALIDVDDAVARLCALYDNRVLLRERSIQAREFAMTYGWDEVASQWDRLLHSVEERRQRSSGAFHNAGTTREVRRTIEGAGGTTIQVRMTSREVGHLEAAVLADVRGRHSDVRIPTSPAPAIVCGVKVIRRGGLVCVGPGSETVLAELQRVFPIVEGWVPHFDRSIVRSQARLRVIRVGELEETLYDIAQSVLIIDLNMSLPKELCRYAALLGTPHVSSVADEYQRRYWPQLAVGGAAAAVAMARRIFTDAALAEATCAVARTAACPLTNVEERAIADRIRATHRERTEQLVAAGG